MKTYNKTKQRTYNNFDNAKTYKKNKRYKSEDRNTIRGRYVTLRDGESAEQLIKRFKRIVESSGVIKELKSREYALSKSQKIRDKKKKALKRLRKKERAIERFKTE